ncbi:MAG: HAD-IB family phosphatase [bacterium]|jgi:phosphoserine phosphatase|nr:hypothetical protein [Planctomycetota bacterium]HIL50644.1 hypothetical protein [Planctomycetota bacterium]
MSADNSPISDAPPPYDTVIFDCDSTLSGIEGIEELAGDLSPRIEALTRRAMEGELPLEEVFGARLELIRPSRADLARVAEVYAKRALPNAAGLVALLRAAGKRVLVVSGGLALAVRPFAEGLGIAAGEVHAVEAYFDGAGEYRGFDEDSSLARAGGKPELLAALAEQGSLGAIALVGDGATDLEAACVTARFVAFGGVVRRASVFARARVHCTRADMAALVPLLLTRAEIDARSGDPAHGEILRGAARL